ASDNGVVPIALIVGAGGVGKSTLAVHAAHAVRNRYPDGQLYVDLRGVEPAPLDPSTVIAGFLRALGYNGAAIPETREERAALYRSALSHRRMLVLLDNAASESQLAPLLPGSDSCGLIVTSRHRLTVPGAKLIELDSLSEAAAVDLLVAVIGQDRVAAERDVAFELIRLCGGLPLALRIAGSR